MQLDEIKALKEKLEKDIAEQLNLFQQVTHCSIVQAHSTVPCSFGHTDKNNAVDLDFRIHIII